LANEIKKALTGVDLLIAHNVCSLSKNLALTAALHKLHQADQLRRLILWHHDLAWTTPRYLPELHEGYPWNLLKTDWGNTTQVVVSDLRQDELADLMKLDRESIHIIPNGVDIDRFYKLEPITQDLLDKTHVLDSSPILLLPVRITPRKNIELALWTLAGLKKDFPHAALVVTGPLGPHNANNIKYFETLTELRKQLGLEGSVHFLAELHNGFLPDEVIADFYRVADALSVERSLFFSNIRRYGNTSSASLLIAACEWFEKGAIPSGELVCFAAFGAGLQWGCLLAEMAS